MEKRLGHDLVFLAICSSLFKALCGNVCDFVRLVSGKNKHLETAAACPVIVKAHIRYIQICRPWYMHSKTR